MLRMTDLDVEEAGQDAGKVAKEGGVGHNNLDKCLKMCLRSLNHTNLSLITHEKSIIKLEKTFLPSI